LQPSCPSVRKKGQKEISTQKKKSTDETRRGQGKSWSAKNLSTTVFQDLQDYGYSGGGIKLGELKN